MFIVEFTMPIGPKVVQLAVFPHSGCLMTSILSEIFIKIWYDIQEHVDLVSHRAMIGSKS